MRTYIIFAALLAVAFALPSEDDMQVQFVAFQHKFEKAYTALEYETRFENFKASLARVERLQAASEYATYGINHFSDMSPKEFKETVLMQNKRNAREISNETFATPVGVPASFDWRTQGAVTAVKNQGQCGSCWAFSATQAIESAWILSGRGTASNVNLAPQQIVDCDPSGAPNGCKGGATENAYGYITKYGQESASNYPYTGLPGSCKYNSAKLSATISGYKPVTGTESTLAGTLSATGPFSICIDASAWQDYSSGVLTAGQCCPKKCQLDHCVQLVGYNTAASVPYWIVRNSWGPNWGVQGYIWLAMGSNTCSIMSDITWPTAS